MPWQVPITVDGLEYPVTFNTEEQPTQQDLDEAVQQILSQRGQAPQPAGETPGYLSQLGSALGLGYRQMKSGVGATFNALTGDNADVAAEMAEQANLQREQQAMQSPEDAEFMRRLDEAESAYNRARGPFETIGALSQYPAAALAEPGAAFKTAVQSAPNALISGATSLAGYGLGGIIGGAAFIETGPGAILTGIAGAAAGGALSNTLMEAGPAIFDVLNEKTQGQAMNMTADQISSFLRENPDVINEGLKTGVIRGSVIGAIEALGVKGSGRLLTMPERAAARAAQKKLVEAGVDVASKEAVEMALLNPSLREATKAAADAAKNQFSSAGNLARMAGASAIETGSAGVGELAAQAAAGQDISMKDAFLESLGEVALAAPMAAGTKMIEGGKYALTPSQEAQQPEATQAEPTVVPTAEEPLSMLPFTREDIRATQLPFGREDIRSTELPFGREDIRATELPFSRQNIRGLSMIQPEIAIAQNAIAATENVPFTDVSGQAVAATIAENRQIASQPTIQPKQAAEEVGDEVIPISEGAERNRAVIAEAAAKLRGEAPQDISAGLQAAIPPLLPEAGPPVVDKEAPAGTPVQAASIESIELPTDSSDAIKGIVKRHDSLFKNLRNAGVDVRLSRPSEAAETKGVFWVNETDEGKLELVLDEKNAEKTEAFGLTDQAIFHETVHAAQALFDRDNQFLSTQADKVFDPNSSEFDQELDSFMANEVPSWSKIRGTRNAKYEAVRALLEAKHLNKTSRSFRPGMPFVRYLSQFIEWAKANVFSFGTAKNKKFSLYVNKIDRLLNSILSAAPIQPQPATTQENAAREIPLEESVREEPQDRIESREAEETGVGDQLLSPAEGEEEVITPQGQPTTATEGMVTPGGVATERDLMKPYANIAVPDLEKISTKDWGRRRDYLEGKLRNNQQEKTELLKTPKQNWESREYNENAKINEVAASLRAAIQDMQLARPDLEAEFRAKSGTKTESRGEAEIIRREKGEMGSAAVDVGGANGELRREFETLQRVSEQPQVSAKLGDTTSDGGEVQPDNRIIDVPLLDAPPDVVLESWNQNVSPPNSLYQVGIISIRDIGTREPQFSTAKTIAGARPKTGTFRDYIIRKQGWIAGRYLKAGKRPSKIYAEAVDSNKIELPEGYIRQGDLYVFQPQTTAAETQTSGVATERDLTKPEQINIKSDSIIKDSTRLKLADEFEKLHSSALKLVASLVNGGILRGSSIDSPNGGKILITKPASMDAKDSVFRLTRLDRDGTPTTHNEISDKEWIEFRLNPDRQRLSLLGELFDAAQHQLRPDVMQSLDLSLGGKKVHYTYKLRNRDAVTGSYPKSGFIKSVGREVIFNRLLSQEEIDSYELIPYGAYLVPSEESYTKDNLSIVSDHLSKVFGNKWSGVGLVYTPNRSDISFGELGGKKIINTAYVSAKEAELFVKSLTQPISTQTTAVKTQTQSTVSENAVNDGKGVTRVGKNKIVRFVESYPTRGGVMAPAFYAAEDRTDSRQTKSKNFPTRKEAEEWLKSGDKEKTTVGFFPENQPIKVSRTRVFREPILDADGKTVGYEDVVRSKETTITVVRQTPSYIWTSNGEQWAKNTIQLLSPQTTQAAAETQTPVPLREGTGAAGVVQSEPVEGSIPTDEKVSPETESESSGNLSTAEAAMSYLMDDLTDAQKAKWTPEMFAAAKAYFDGGGKDFESLQKVVKFPRVVSQAYLKADKAASEEQARIDKAQRATDAEIAKAEREEKKLEAEMLKREEMRSKAIDSIIGAAEKKKRKFGQVTNSDAIAAVAMLVSSKDVPGVLTTWTGTKEDFLRDPANQTADPEIYARIKAGELVEGFFNKGRAYVFLDGIGVSEADMLRGEQMGVTPQVAAVRRVLLHESLVHRGIHGLPLRHRRLILNWVRQNSTPAELDDLAKVYTEYANWRNSDYEFEALAEELLAKKVDSLTEIPKDGPMGKLMDILRQIWDFIVGYKREPTLSDLKSVIKLLKSGAEALSNDRLKDGGEVKLSMIAPTAGITPEMDAEYLAAVQAGDMEKAQRMVDEAAKAANPDSLFIDAGETQTDKLRWVRDADAQIAFYKRRIASLPTDEQIELSYQRERVSAAKFFKNPDSPTVEEIIGAIQAGVSVPRGTLADAIRERDMERASGEKEIAKYEAQKLRAPKGGEETAFKTGQPTLTKVFHATPFGRLDSFDDDMLGGFTGAPSAKMAHFFAGSSAVAETYFADQGWALDQKGFFRLSADQKKELVSAVREELGDSPSDQEVANLAEELFDTEYDASKIQNELHEVLVNLRNPLVYDFKGEGYRDVSFRELLEKAEAEGYDGVVMANTYDAGPAAQLDDKGESTNIVAVLRGHANQIKSADPVTYDDAGNVIPLSQRFQTASPDIRFSRPQFSSDTSAALSAGSEAARSTLYSERDMDIREAIRRAYEAMPKTNSVAVPIGELFAKTEELMPGVTQDEFSLVLQDLFEDNGAVLQEGDVVEPLAEQDRRYLALAEDEGANREELQRMVDEAAKAAGYDKEAFKAMPEKDWRTEEPINVIKSTNGPWAGFFTDTKEVADRFGRIMRQPVRRAFLKLTKPFEVDASGKAAGELQFDILDDSGAHAQKNNAEILAAINNGQYDSIVLKNTTDEGTVMVPLDPSQIKSADPVTRDDQGRIIPLSRRFDTGADIRGQINVTTPEGRRAGFVVVMPSKSISVPLALRSMAMSEPSKQPINQQKYDEALAAISDFLSGKQTIQFPGKLALSSNARVGIRSGDSRITQGLGEAARTTGGETGTGTAGGQPSDAQVQGVAQQGFGPYSVRDLVGEASRIGVADVRIDPESKHGAYTTVSETGEIYIGINPARMANRIAANDGDAQYAIGSILNEELIHAADMAVMRDQWLSSGSKLTLAEFVKEQDVKTVREMIQVAKSSNDPLEATRILFDAITSSVNLYAGNDVTSLDSVETFLNAASHDEISSVMGEFVRQMIQTGLYQTVSEKTLFRKFIEKVKALARKIADVFAPAKEGRYGKLIKERLNGIEELLAYASTKTGAKASRIRTEDATEAAKTFQADIIEAGKGRIDTDSYQGNTLKSTEAPDHNVNAPELYKDAAISLVDSLLKKHSITDIANSFQDPEFRVAVGLLGNKAINPNVAQQAELFTGAEIQNRLEKAFRDESDPAKKRLIEKTLKNHKAYYTVATGIGQNLNAVGALQQDPRFKWMFLFNEAEKEMADKGKEKLNAITGGTQPVTDTVNQSEEAAADEATKKMEGEAEEDQDAIDLAAGEETLDERLKKLYEELKDWLRTKGAIVRARAARKSANAAKASLSKEQRDAIMQMSDEELDALEKKADENIKRILNTILGKESDAKTTEQKKTRAKRKKMVDTAKKRAEAGKSIDISDTESAVKIVLREMGKARPGKQVPLTKLMPWKDIIAQKAKTVDEYRQRILDAMMASDAFKEVSDEDKAKIADIFAKQWDKKRTDILDRMLEREIDRKRKEGSLSEAAAKALQKSRNKIIELANLGGFDNDDLMKVLGEKFGIKTGFSEAEKARISELADKLQDETLNPAKRNKLAMEFAVTLSGASEIPVAEIIANWWTSSVLFGPQTIFSIGAAFVNGAYSITTIGTRRMLADLTRGDVKGAIEESILMLQGIAKYLGAFKQAGRRAWSYLWTGNVDVLGAAANDILGEINSLEELKRFKRHKLLAENLAKDPRALRRYVGMYLRFVNRLLTSLDAFNVMVTKAGTASLALRMSGMSTENIIKAEKMLNLKAYKDQVIRDYFDNKAPTTQDGKALVDSYAEAEMYRTVDQLGGKMENADYLASESAMTMNPTGLGGFFYRSITGLDSKMKKAAEDYLEKTKKEWTTEKDLESALFLGLAYLRQFAVQNLGGVAGYKFIRFASNKFNQGISYLPMVGLLRTLEAKGDEIKGKEAFIETIHRNQVIGAVLTLAAIAVVKALEEEPDDDKRGNFWNGGWENLTPDQKKQMLAKGQKEYTMGFKFNGRWYVFNYQNWPLNQALAAIGSMSDQIRFSPKQWKEKGSLSKPLAGIVSGFKSTLEIPALSQLGELAGNRLASKDPTEQTVDRLSRVAAGWVGGFVPRILKDLDFATQPELRKYKTLWEKTASHIPIYRRYVGEDYYDILGQPIKRNVIPGSREFMMGPTEPEYKILGALNSRNIFLTPANAEYRMVGKGRNRRRLTQEEADAYSLETGKGYRQMLLRYGQRALQMPTERARAFLSDKADEVRDRALKKVYRGYK